MIKTKTIFVRVCAMILAILLFVPTVPFARATVYDEGCVTLPEGEDTEVEIDYDETYDGFYDDYLDNYGFVDEEGNLTKILIQYTVEENLALARAYVKYREHPDMVDRYGVRSFENFVAQYENSGATATDEFLNCCYDITSTGGDVSVASEYSSAWYFDTGVELPNDAVYGYTNLIGNVRKGDIVYERNAKLTDSINGHIAIVEGVFWDDASSRFYIRLIEVTSDGGVCRGILDETRMTERGSEVLRLRASDKMDRHAAVDFCLAQLGENYSLHESPRYTAANNAWYCSELVWAAYKNAGIELFPNHGNNYINPVWFYDSDDVDHLDISTDFPSEFFVDDNVPWVDSEISFVADNGIMTGISKSRFAPYLTMSRAMLVTILYRLAGSPSVEGTSDFEDVTNVNLYYYDAVIWGAENGIVQGMTATVFGPDKVVTREQFATFLYRFAVYKGYDVSYSNTALNGFTDSASVSAYALTPMKWAVYHGVINGTSSTTLEPKDGSNRAQAAVMTYRLIQNVMSA